MTIVKTCRKCGEQTEIAVPEDGYNQWLGRRACIQDAMPKVSADDRELMISGICGSCFDKMFEE